MPSLEISKPEYAGQHNLMGGRSDLEEAKSVNNRFNSPFVIVGPPGVDENSVAEMLKAIGTQASTAGDLFPKVAHEGPCRICGETRMLTEEHIPPRGAFNKERGRTVEVGALLSREELEMPDEGEVFQGGISGFTLCDDCNNLTGTCWGREYQEWARRAAWLMRSQPQLPPEVDETPGYARFPSVTFKEVFPGRLVRQVLSMMLSISGSAELGRRFSDVRELVLGGSARPLPEPLRLYFLLYGSSTARICGGEQGQAWWSVSERVLRRILSVDFCPLAFVLLIEGPKIPALGVDISSFTTWEVHKPGGDVEFSNLPLGFGHKPWPADYRSRGQMLADRVELDGE